MKFLGSFLDGLRLSSIERGWKRIPSEYRLQLQSFNKNKEKILKFRMLNENDYYAIHDNALWTFAVRKAMESVRNYKPRVEIELGEFRDSLEVECLEILAENFGVTFDEILKSKRNYKR